MLRCKPGEAWGVRGRSSPRLVEHCDGAVYQCRDVGENVVPRRVLTSVGHHAHDRREVTRRARADRSVRPCVDWPAASCGAMLRCRADRNAHRMRLLERAYAQHLNAGAAECVTRCVDDAGTTWWLLAGHQNPLPRTGPGYAVYLPKQ